MSQNISETSQDTIVCSNNAETVVESDDSVNSNDLLNKSWGKVRMINGKTSALDEEITCDIYIGGNVYSLWIIPNENVLYIPDTQCSIKKDNSDVHNPVMIEDLSSNGIYVNGELVKFMRKRILKSRDEVAFNTTDNKIFFFENYYEEQYSLPGDVNLRFHVGKLLGCGTYGKVFEVIERSTLHTFAMKELKLNSPANSLGYVSSEQAYREVNLTKGLHHEHVIMFHDVIWKQDAVYIILEFMKGGDLRGFINTGNNLSVKSTQRFFRQLSSAVEYLHHQKIVHCDIKPENILLTENHHMVKLADLGLSQKLEESFLLGKCGTSLYAAPGDSDFLLLLHFYQLLGLEQIFTDISLNLKASIQLNWNEEI